MDPAAADSDMKFESAVDDVKPRVVGGGVSPSAGGDSTMTSAAGRCSGQPGTDAANGEIFCVCDCMPWKNQEYAHAFGCMWLTYAPLL